MTRERRFGRDAGLTLVELLVVLVVLSMLSGLALIGLRSAAEGWRRLTEHNAESEELLAVRGQLQRLISQIYPAKRGNSSQSVMRFSGDSGRIDFLAPLAQRFGAEDVVLYTLRFPGDGTMHIAWRLDRDLEAASKGQVPEGDEVIQGVSEGSLSYYGQAADGGESRWWPSWKERRTLPLLLRTHFLWRGQVQELVLAPLATAAFCSTSVPAAACSD
ncbi:prepilin-type N-terminal cleavage/methylation domain-containing protein [Rhizobiales bacterium GAS191]|nr:prepilin-type N-terminal cleavage/methylation domain-containing protein [Rhizobiales bacterium GAS113]SED86130.1 prepilin-type N-terminal cleavage/methylation domain-containing protein [Rhizobiales bacterium GAS191]SEE60713.1 prepilin-type N-terminal cleavage/methylation domain-containing protein [Rhizobiales bacterium GAS188]